MKPIEQLTQDDREMIIAVLMDKIEQLESLPDDKKPTELIKQIDSVLNKINTDDAIIIQTP